MILVQSVEIETPMGGEIYDVFSIGNDTFIVEDDDYKARFEGSRSAAELYLSSAIKNARDKSNAKGVALRTITVYYD